LNKFVFSQQISIEVSNIKFHGEPSSGTLAYTRRQKKIWTDGLTAWYFTWR